MRVEAGHPPLPELGRNRFHFWRTLFVTLASFLTRTSDSARASTASRSPPHSSPASVNGCSFVLEKRSRVLALAMEVLAVEAREAFHNVSVAVLVPRS